MWKLRRSASHISLHCAVCSQKCPWPSSDMESQLFPLISSPEFRGVTLASWSWPVWIRTPWKATNEEEIKPFLFNSVQPVAKIRQHTTKHSCLKVAVLWSDVLSCWRHISQRCSQPVTKYGGPSIYKGIVAQFSFVIDCLLFRLCFNYNISPFPFSLQTLPYPLVHFLSNSWLFLSIHCDCTLHAYVVGWLSFWPPLFLWYILNSSLPIFLLMFWLMPDLCSV